MIFGGCQACRVNVGRRNENSASNQQIAPQPKGDTTTLMMMMMMMRFLLIFWQNVYSELTVKAYFTK